MGERRYGALVLRAHPLRWLDSFWCSPRCVTSSLPSCKSATLGTSADLWQENSAVLTSVLNVFPPPSHSSIPGSRTRDSVKLDTRVLDRSAIKMSSLFQFPKFCGKSVSSSLPTLHPLSPGAFTPTLRTQEFRFRAEWRE